MASRPDHQSLPGTTALAGFDPIIFAFIDDLRVREGIAGKHVGRFRGTARQRSNVFSSTIASAVEAYLRASPAEKLRILETNVPPSIRPGTFPGATDSLMRVLGGGDAWN